MLACALPREGPSMRFIVALLALLVASGAEAQTLRIGIASDPDVLDPTLSRSVAGRQVFAALCDKLVDIDADLRIVPQLATAWAWSDDGRTLSLTLRPGVRFQDDLAMDAAAVQMALQRHFTMQGSTRRPEMGPVTSIEVAGPLEVRVHLATPFAPLVAALADRAGMMVSPRATGQTGAQFADNPSCAGPFKLVRRIAQDRIELSRFDGYWDEAAVHFDRVIYLPVPDSTVRSAGLRAGSLDLIEQISPSDLVDLRADKRVKLFTGPSLASVYIAVNVANGPRSKSPIGQTSAVREALDDAIDRGVLNQVAFEGAYIPGNQSVAPGRAFYASRYPVPPRRVEHAREVLKQAGLGRVRVQMSVPNTSEYRQAAEVIQSMASEAGIDMELVPTEVATLLKQWTDGDFETLIVAWSGRVDIDGNLYNFNACGAALNGGHYCNRDLDALLTQGRSSTAQAARQDIYARAAGIYLADRPYIYLWHSALITGAAEKLDGLRLIPDGLLRPQGLRLRAN